MTEGEVWLKRAETLLDQRRLSDAWQAFSRARTSGAPQDRCDAGRWTTAMLKGNFEAAWRQSDALRAHDSPDPHRFWTGADIRGARLIVRCLHGLGDTVQMLQYAPRLQEQAASVLFEVPPRLLPLATCFRGVRETITWGELAPRDPPPWDLQIEVMELPYLFRTRPEELPLATRYLELPAAEIMETATRMQSHRQSNTHTSNTRKVGLVWTAGEWNPERSIPLTALHPLIHQQGLGDIHILELWNLQAAHAGSAAAEADTIRMRNAKTISGDGLVALAATIANLDLVITVDTLAAHLAGALGTPAWVLLQHAADWRWMHARNDSPWYPRMRLFRQLRQGDWTSVVDAVLLALKGGI